MTAVTRRPVASPPTAAKPSLDEGLLQRILGYRLAQAAVTTGQVFEARVAQAFELRPVEFTVLALVHQNPGVTGGQLASALAVTPPNITMWIDRLSKRGYVEREPHPGDRRAMHIRTTPAGDEVVRQATEQLFEGEHHALAALTTGERMLLAELLDKVARARARPRAVARTPSRPLGLPADLA